jgi:hypothetical protein
VQIVDHQHDRLVERVKVGQQPLDDGPAVKGRRADNPLHQLVLADGTGELIDDRQPEPLRVALAAVHRDPSDPIDQAFGLDPGPQEDCLPAPRWRAHEDHLA